ncbi:MAG TPA: universal stress protein [Halothiobacillus sp.]|nr:universal stress protein [Halothiobacillus sp.]
MYHNILVAIDGSHTSERALREAIDLTKELKGQLLIVHAVEIMLLNWEGAFVDPSLLWNAMIKDGEDVLRKACAAAEAADAQAETKLIKIDTLGDRIPDVIEREAQNWHADLIVIGTHGRRGISHIFMGSVAEGIVRVATKPVLLIRGE